MARRDRTRPGGMSDPELGRGDGAAPSMGRPALVADGRSEEQLISAIRAGDPGAWAELARRILPRVYGLCYRMLGKRDDAADAAQASMLRLVQVLDQYDSRSRFSTWAYRVTANICISRMRSAKIRRASSLDASSGSTEPRVFQVQGREPDPRSGVELSDAARRLSVALASLEPDQRAILILRDGQDLSYEHIAGVLDVSLGTVKSRLFRARGALRAAMEGSSASAAPGSREGASRG